MINVTKLKALLNPKILASIIAVCGFINGADALSTAEASKPPLGWTAIGVIFIFCSFAFCFLLGIQVLTKNREGIQMGWKFFFFVCIYFLSMGISALGLALWRNSFSPAALLYIAISAGLAVGLTLTKPMAIQE